MDVNGTNAGRPSPLATLRALAARSVWRPLAWLGVRVFGRLQWQAPAWGGSVMGGFRSTSDRLRARPRVTLAALLAVLLLAVLLLAVLLLAGGGMAGYKWWKAQPKPLEVTFKVSEPARTEIENDDAQARKPKPVLIVFDHSVAQLSQVGKDVAAGVSLSPATAGVWHWNDDRTLAFTPTDDWGAGALYSVRFQKTLFKPEARLAAYEAQFSTAPFVATLTKSQFYQDPVNPTVKKAVFELRFTYPVNPAELEKRIELRQQEQAAGILGIGKESTRFTVSYDKLKLNAFVHSENLPIPKDSGEIGFTLAKGLAAARGSGALDYELSGAVAVPGLYSLSVSDIKALVVTNDKNEPEQVLVLQTSASVHEREMQKALALWVLPRLHPDPKMNSADGEPFDWSGAEVTEAVLKDAARLAPQAVPAEREYTQVHSAKYRADVGAYLYVQVATGIKSFGGYLMGQAEARVLRVPPYPSELKIVSAGALLALSGEKKVAVMVRDLPGVKIEIGRLLPSQLQHLVSQSGGNFANPQFYERFGADNLTERFEHKVPLPNLERGRAHYEAIDLGQYLKSDGAERRGVFLLTVSGYDPKAGERAAKRAAAAQRRPGEAPPEQAGEGEGEGDCIDCGDASERDAEVAKVDKRLVLVTDLGIVVKKSQDGSQDVYIQSIYSGKPVDGASVEIVGVNGQVLFTQATDAGGHVRFPKIDALTRERAPLMVLARKGGDLSFMPLGRYDRGLDMSRFDVGGARNAFVADQLAAYLFSDRGVYRPGDTFHIGMIAKPASWATGIEGLPLQVDILDPRGLTVKRETIKLPAGGLIETSYTTQESAPTGSYTVNLHLVRDGQAGAQVGSTSVKVQEFQPDRMKVSARFSAAPSEGWLHPKDLKAAVSAFNLFGTPAQQRRVSAEITLSPAFPAFSRYPDYTFYDPQRAKEGYSTKLADQSTNDKGEAEFDLGLDKYAKATYRVNFVARAFEAQGGRGVAAEAAALVSERPYLVGFKADGALDFVSRASRRSVAVIAIDPKAQKSAVDGLTLQFVERKFVSVLTRQANDTFKYESRKKEVTLKETPLAIAAAGQNLALATDTPGNFAYVIRDAQGVEMNRIEYAVAGRGNVTRSLERNAELQLTLNKKDYAPGEEIEVSIKAPYAGAGLLTIERDKVFTHQWFKTDTLASVQKVRLPKDFEGNGYVSVQFIRDPGSDEIFISPLSYGTVPFATSLAARTNPLTLAVPELVKPGARMTIKLTSARAARVVVFAVDEGILQVARYQAPDPLGLFFQKRMLEVRTSQILDLILPEFKKLMAASAPGGDADGALGRHLNPFKRKRDKPAVYWSGIVEVNGSKEFGYDVPETFNGSMRVFAVAVNDSAIGTAQAKTTVRGDFVLSPNLPLAVAPGDEFEVSVGVANNVAESGKDAPVAVTLKTSPHLAVQGSATQALKIGAMRESVALFRVKAVDGALAQLGSAGMTFTAAMGAKSARLSADVSVRPPAPRYAETTMGSFKGALEVPVKRKLYAQFRTLEAGVSALPLVMAGALSNYLADFTHLCTEQLVSQAVPALILAQRPEFGKSGARLQLARSLDDAVRLLRTRQNAEGGFGMWGASVQADEFASVYALHLLLEARERGAGVPADMVQQGLGYLRQLAASPSKDLPGLRVRAYAAYLLTRQMTVTTPMLASIRESLEKLYPKLWQLDPAAAYLAAAYQLQKQERQAGALMDQQVARLVRRSVLAVQGAQEPRLYFVDPLVEDAQTLYLLSRHFPARAKALPPEVMATLAKPLADGRYNTLSGGYLILAFDAYASAIGPEVAGKLAIAELDAGGAARALALPNNLVPRVPFGAGAAKLRFANDSGLQSYYAVTQTGFDKEVPTAELRAGIEVLREFVDGAGKPVATVMVGDEVTVRLKVRAVGRTYLSNVALIDLMPGGFEPVLESAAPAAEAAPPPAAAPMAGSSLPGLAGGRSTRPIDYTDVREDRVVFYGSVSADFSELSYRIKATNSGRFTVPPAYAEALYERGVQARSAGGRSITVDTPGKK